MEWVTAGVTACTSWFNGLFDIISGNTVLGAIFVGTTIIPIAFHMLHSFKN